MSNGGQGRETTISENRTPPSVEPNELGTIVLVPLGTDDAATMALFERLYLRYRSRIHTFLTGFADAESAEDLTQETFMRVFRRGGTFECLDDFEHWLFSIAINAGKNWWRARKTLKRDRPVDSLDDLLERLGDGQAELSAEARVPESNPARTTLGRERLRALVRAIKGLPRKRRQCVALRVFQDLKLEEIAALVGCSAETVKAHLYQARTELRAELAAYFGPREL